MKFFDIPHTVKEASLKIAKLGVDILNVHTLGGKEMMEAALEGASQGASMAGHQTPKVIGVTILTSTDQQQLQETITQQLRLNELVDHLANLAHSSGLDGVVCSATDLPQLYQKLPSSFMTITPGIAGTNYQHGADQKRVCSAEQAIQNGAHLLVIGRAISSFPTRQERIAETKNLISAIAKHIE
jgi:orotidine-5'-phosphate decarboxylase